MLNMVRRRELDYSKITDDLYVGRLPRTQDHALLDLLHVGLVINMRFDKRMKHDTKFGINTLWLPAIDTPLTPISVAKIDQGVAEALATIGQGKAVYVNCKLGRHRSVIVASCILVAKGYTAQEAMKLIKRQRPVADFDPRYVRKQIERYESRRATVR